MLDGCLEGVGHGAVGEAPDVLAGLVAEASGQRRILDEPA